MVEKLLVYERELFLTLNGSHTPFWDNFMWLYTGKYVWLPIICLIIVLLFYKKDWREPVLIILAIGLVVLFCDQLSSHICKPLFTRFRPTHHPDFMNEVTTVFDYRGGLYGFISGHAANSFGLTMYLSLLFRDKLFMWVSFGWATLMSYTRIYLGVHFITDIIPGALSGLLFGALIYYLYAKVRSRCIPGACTPSLIYSKKRKHILAYAILTTILLISLLNQPLVSLLRH